MTELEPVRAEGGTRLWKTLSLLLVILLAIALWKPWEAVEPRPTGLTVLTTTPPPATVLPPSPTPAPSAHPDAIACIAAAGWRVVTRDVTAGRESRTWIAVTPVVAEGPRDPSIPFVRTVVGRLMALGYCLPAELAGLDGEVRAWRLGPDEPVPQRTARPLPPSELPLRLIVDQMPATATIYAPPDDGAAWPADRYVFEVALATAAGASWFGVHVEDSSALPDDRSPEPSTSPGP